MENKKGERFIVCVNRAGIGNRLRGLISAIRLCKLLDRKLLLYWENNQYLGCNFNDLFENKFDEIETEHQLNIIKIDDSKVYRDVLEERFDDYTYIILDTWKWIFLPGEIDKDFNKTYASKTGENIDFEFERIPKNLREEILKELNTLKLSKEVIEKVENFESKHNLSEYNGMHMRRGDNKFTTDGREKVSSDDKFAKIILKNPNEKFFISSDSVLNSLSIKTLFPERVIFYPQEDKKRSQKESIQEALAAIILLSKTKKLYGSFLSTFTEMVWWFSDCKIDVEIVGIKDVKKEFYPKTLFQKIMRKIRFYKVNFLRWAFKIYR